MTRAVLATAAALAAVTLFAPTAQACISCNYTPEVVREGKKAGKSYSLRSGRAARSSARKARLDIARAKARRQPQKASRPAAATAVARTAPAKATSGNPVTQTTGASLSLMKGGTPAEPGQTPAAPEATATEINQGAPAIAAAPAVEAPPAAEAEATSGKPAAAKDLGCKKFFPSAGITLSVACD